MKCKISKRIDLTGQRFGMLTVLKMVYDNKKKNFSHCECLCDCGKTVIKGSYPIRHSKQEPSCGCKNREHMIKKLSKKIEGQKFGRLLILESIWDDVAKVKCLCDCGKEVILNRNSVITKHTKSCGCLQKDTMRNIRLKDDTNYVSDFGVKILKPYKRNKKGQLVWECECGYCNNHFYSIPARIKNNHIKSCGCLISSSMESYIKNFLDQNNINYETQYTYEDCINKKGNKLRFDFAIKKNQQVYFLIEYDGKQHFESIDYFGGEEGFKTRLEYDKIKTDYCRNNNIPLLRLPYYLSNDEIKQEITNIINP